MPLAVRFGLGYGRDTKFLDQRPGNEFMASEWQKTHNNFFQRDSLTKKRFEDQRPPWFVPKTEQAISEALIPPSPGRLGEWELKWIPRNRSGLSGRNGADSRSGDGAVARLTKKKRSEHNIIRPQSVAGAYRQPHSANAVPRPATSLEVEEPPTTNLLRPENGVNLKQKGEAEILSMKDTAEPPDARLMAKYHDRLSIRISSRKSQRSDSSYYCTTCSDLSCSLADTAGILQRVKALEDALRSEKAIREKMQEMLTKVGDGRPPGVTLPYPPSH